MNGSVIAALRTYISQKHGSVRSHAAAKEIEDLESNLKTVLPDEVRLLYLESNGTDYDEDVQRFLPLDEIFVDDEGVVIIFERSIFAETWGFRKTENRSNSAIFSSGLLEVADSLEDFLRILSV